LRIRHSLVKYQPNIYQALMKWHKITQARQLSASDVM
jgi:hypothetical protein